MGAKKGYNLKSKGYIYRVFLTNIRWSVLKLIDFYDGRVGVGNLIKEANHDAGVAAFTLRKIHCQYEFFSFSYACLQFQSLADALCP